MLFVVVYTIKVIIEIFPNLKKELQRKFDHQEEPLEKIYNLVERVNEFQKKGAHSELHLKGSLVDGYDETIFEISVKEYGSPHWEMVGNEFLEPVNINVKFIHKDKEKCELINLQHSCAVVEINKNKKKYIKLAISDINFNSSEPNNVEYKEGKTELKKIIESIPSLKRSAKPIKREYTRKGDNINR